MVRRAERPLFGQPFALLKQSQNGVDSAGLQHLLFGHLRQNGGKGLCKQALSAAGASNKEKVMGTGGSYLHSSLGPQLSLDVCKLRIAGVRCGVEFCRGQFICQQRAGVIGMQKNGDHICQICGREDIYPIHLQSLQGRVLWKDACFESAPARVNGYWKRPAHRPQSAVKGQLSHNHKLVQTLLRKFLRANLS